MWQASFDKPIAINGFAFDTGETHHTFDLATAYTYILVLRKTRLWNEGYQTKILALHEGYVKDLPSNILFGNGDGKVISDVVPLLSMIVITNPPSKTPFYLWLEFYLS